MSKKLIVSDDEGEDADQVNETTDDETSEDEYIVEKILDKKERRGKTFYRIKWKGFLEDEATWEPEDNCNCKGLIEEYENNLGLLNLKKKAKIQETSLKNDSDSLKTRNVPENDAIDVDPVKILVEEKPKLLKSLEKDLDGALPPAVEVKMEKAKNFSLSCSSSFESEAVSSNSVQNKFLPVQTNSSKTPKSETRGREDDKIFNGLSYKPAERNSSDSSSANCSVESLPESTQTEEKSGFELGLTPRKVLGLIRQGPTNSLHMLVAWDDPVKTPDVIPNFIANEKCPDLVIQYYEKHLRWKSVQPTDSSSKINQVMEPKSKKSRHY